MGKQAPVVANETKPMLRIQFNDNNTVWFADVKNLEFDVAKRLVVSFEHSKGFTVANMEFINYWTLEEGR